MFGELRSRAGHEAMVSFFDTAGAMILGVALLLLLTVG
jgi:hypothetical protein